MVIFPPKPYPWDGPSTSGSSSCAKLEYAKEDFLCTVKNKNFNSVVSDTSTEFDTDDHTGNDTDDVTAAADTITAQCLDSKEYDKLKEPPFSGSLCGENVTCTVGEPNADNSFNVDCELQNTSLNCVCALAVSSTDIAGNGSTEILGEVRIDNFAPHFIGEGIVDKETVKSGDQITIEFIASEEVAAATVKIDSRTFCEDCDLNCDDETFVCQFRYTSDENVETGGQKNVFIEITDLAGNIASETFEKIVNYDFAPPEVSVAPEVSRSLVSNGEEFTVEFSVSKQLSEIAVRVWDPITEKEDSLDEDIDSNCKTNQVCSFHHAFPSNTELAGSTTIFIEMTDLAGNSTEFEFTDLLAYDFVPPSLDGEIQILPNIATDDDQVKITLQFSESIQQSSLILNYGALTGVRAVQFLNDTEVIITYTVNENDAQGTYPISIVSVLDIAGNKSTGIEIGDLQISRTIYVNGSVADSGNGLSWNTAYKSLTDALADPRNINEIWIANGFYQPDNPPETFTLKNGLRVYGGFEGDEEAIDNRSFQFNALEDNDDSLETVLDGYNFVYQGDASSRSASLDGVVIQNSGPWAGIFLSNTKAPFTLKNCVVQNNSLTDNGGGLRASNADVMIHNCRFSDNHSDSDGGAVYAKNSQLQVLQSVFEGNTSNQDGGAMYLSGPDDIIIVNCKFIENSSISNGGAIGISDAIVRIDNSVFFENVADMSGGAIAVDADAEITAAHCTFVRNDAVEAGEDIYLKDSLASTTVHNSIFWYGSDTVSDCSAPIEAIDSNGIHVESSNMFGCGDTDTLPSCTNCIYEDPLFVGPYDDVNLYDLSLLPNSPCINSGNNEYWPKDYLDLDTDGDTDEHLPFDIDMKDRCLSGPDSDSWTVDMGAYEY